MYLSITEKMQRYTIFFITLNDLHVSGGFSAHHQELKNCTHNTGYISSCNNTGCFKKSFTTLKAYRNLYRGHTQGFELSKCSKTH